MKLVKMYTNEEMPEENENFYGLKYFGTVTFENNKWYKVSYDTTLKTQIKTEIDNNEYFFWVKEHSEEKLSNDNVSNN